MGGEMPRVAFVYDFDGTLSPRNMQEYGYLPQLGIEADKFWETVREFAAKQEAGQILSYMYMLLKEAKYREHQLDRATFAEAGKGIEYYPGVGNWFGLTRTLGRERGLAVHHYILSSGIEEILEGCSIYGEFTRVFASSYMYDINGVAFWPRLAMDYTLKTQFLFRISKGALDLRDDVAVNRFMPQGERPIPFSRMVYFGDGLTDVPCMRLVKAEGGYSVAVYKENDERALARAQKLYDEDRVQFVAPANYSAGQRLEDIARSLLTQMSAELQVQKLYG